MEGGFVLLHHGQNRRFCDSKAVGKSSNYDFGCSLCGGTDFTRDCMLLFSKALTSAIESQI
jgi:hypothetical protein